MEFNEVFLMNETFRPHTVGEAINLIQRIEDNGACFTSTSNIGEERKVTKYGLWNPHSENSKPSVISRLTKFHNNVEGLFLIPRGDQVLLREAVAKQVADSSQVLELSLEMSEGKLPSGCGFGNTGRDEEGYIDNLEFDFANSLGEKINGKFIDDKADVGTVS